MRVDDWCRWQAGRQHYCAQAERSGAHRSLACKRLSISTTPPAALQGVLTAQELRLLVASYHRPSFALAVLSELAAEAPVNEVQRIRLDENLTYFQQCVGECERLLRTPIPLSYTRHTSRFMVSQCARVGATCCCVLGWGFGSWGLRAGLHLRPFFVRQDLHSILPACLPAGHLAVLPAAGAVALLRVGHHPPHRRHLLPATGH